MKTTKLEQTVQTYADIYKRDFGDVALLDHDHPEYSRMLEHSNMLNQLLTVAYDAFKESKKVKA